MKSHYNIEKADGLKKVFLSHETSVIKLSGAKTAMITLVLFFVFATLQATNYYSQSGLTPSATTSWWTATNATGTHPSNFTTAGDVFIIQSGHTMTSSATWTVTGSLTISSGAILNCVTYTHTITGAINNAGTVNITTGRLVQSSTGSTADFTNSGTISITSTGRLYFAGNFVNTGTLTLGSAQIRFIGNNPGASTISGFTTTGTVTFSRSAGSVTLSGNVNGGALTLSGSGGTLNLGTGLTHTFTGTWTRTNGTLNCNSSILNLSGSTSGTGGTINTNTGTINYTGASQTLFALTYNNLTLSGSGAKTFPSGTTTVNGVLSIENGTNANTFTGSLAYGTGATLQYNAGSSARTVSTEWPATFSGTGGVVIKGTGAISLNGAKVISNGIPLTINSNAILTPGSNLITLGGDFINSGTLTSGAGGISINGTTVAQNIGAFTTTGPVTIGGTVNQSLAAFTTTGTVSMTKTAGTATFTGNVGGGALTINGSGGTLNLGNSLTHTFTGDITLTAGSLNGGSSTLNANSTTATAWNGTGSLFTGGTGTVVFGGTNQTLAASATRFYSVTFSGTSANKTITNAITVDNDLNINSSAVVLFANGTTSTTKDIYFNWVAQVGGSWGGSTSAANNKNATYFGSSTTGILNVSNVQYFRITGSSSQTAGTSQNITITAYNAGGTVLSTYTGDKLLTFSGANSSISPVNAPTIKDKTGTAVAFGSSTTITFSNGVASVSGGNNGVLTLYKAENANISATDGTLSSSGSDRLSITVVPASITMSFSTQPNGGTPGSVWSSQPVITFRDVYGNPELASNPHTVALSISNNAGPGGTLSGTTSVDMNTLTSQAAFSSLSIDKAGSGYTLQAATSGLSSVTSTGFDITNPTPTMTNISPTFQCAGSSAFTMIVNGTNFSSSSVVKINGSSRTTTFVNSTELTAAILSSDVSSAGTPAITVYTPSPGGGTTSSATLTVTQVSIGSAIVQPACSADGTITITASGGTAPYTYDWFDLSGTNNVQNRVGLKAGSYQITVTDANGCSATSGVFVLNAASNCTGISVCQSDVASVLSVTPNPNNTSYTWTLPTDATIVSGQGTPSVKINWTGVAIGAYQVSVIASNGCGNSSQSFIDIYIEKPTISAYAEPVCSGSPLYLYAYGGEYYSWTGPNGFISQSANPVILSPTAGTYNVTITNEKGCSASTSVVVTINAAPTMSNVVVKNADCSSSTGSITLSSISGGSGFTFAWTGPNGFSSSSQNLTGLLNGTYTVKVTNSTGCSSTQSFNVGLTAGPEVVFNTVNNVSCKNGNDGKIIVAASGSTSTYSYDWVGPNGFTATKATSIILKDTISTLYAGTYTLTMTDDALGCTTIASVNITEPTAIQADGVVTNINCYGSSTGSIVQTVSGGVSTYTYAWTGPNSFTASTKDISNRPAGTYSVTITDHAGVGSCTLVKSYTITQPSAAISATPSITNAKCYGDANGQVTLAVSGGTSPYTYLWTGPSTYTATTPNINGLGAGSYAVTITDAKGCSTSLSNLSVTQPSAALSTTGSTQSNVTIYGNKNGSVTLAVAGGTSPYTYAWSNGATSKDLTNLVAGTYSVLITDANNCTTTASFTITTPTQLTASAVAAAATCNNTSTGSVTLTVGGGATPYTYLWSNSATSQNLSNVASGFYSVTVTDHNGATVGASATVNNPALIVINGSVTNVLCNGSSTGAITLSVSGGTGSYNYDWADIAGTNNSQNRSGLTAGTYTVTVSDANGCSSSQSFTITQPTSLSLSISQTNVLCHGDNSGSISLTVSGGKQPYTYLWSNAATTQNITGLTAGNYSVTVTDANSCTASSSTITLTQPANSLTSSISHTNVSCKGGNNGTITFTPGGGTTPYSYAWSNGSTAQSLSSLEDGTYSVVITDAKGCTTTNSAVITEPATVIELYATSKNASGCGGATGSITLTVVNGTSPFNYSWSGPSGYSSGSKDITNLNSGNYSVTVTDYNGCSSSLAVTVGHASSLSVVVTAYDKSCPVNDGSVYAVASGGVEPYTYLWTGGSTNNNRTNLGTGTYSVTVTDANGCTASSSGTVNSPSCAAPVAAVYNFTTTNTTPLAKSVATSKVTDADNTLNQLSFIGLTIPTPDQGTLDWDPSNGGFVYNPSPTYNGLVSVNYQVVDPTGLTSTSKLNITVKQEVQTYNIVATPSFTAAKLKWKNGSRSARAVFMSESASVISDPVYGTTFTASANWNNKGTQLGNSGYYCIYNGTDTTVYLTHLYPGTQYKVQAYEYDGTSGSEDYLTNLTGAYNPITVTPWPSTTFKNSTGVSTQENWNTAVRWDHDTIPTAALHPAVLVYIDGNCLITNAAECNNLTIKAVHGAVTPKLTINPVQSLNVIGPFTNSGLASALVIKSSETLPNGSLTWGTGSVKGTVEMYSKATWNLKNAVNNKYKWQYVGIPVKTLTAGSTFDFSKCFVREWDESVTSMWDVWSKRNDGSSLYKNASSTLTQNRCYELVQQVPTTYIFSGDLLDTDFTQSLSYTSTAAYKGQNIFGNPYTAAINIGDQIKFTNAEMSVYLYNTGTFNDWTTTGAANIPGSGPGQYIVSTPGTAGTLDIPSQIPSMQSFLVKSNAGGGSITISKSKGLTANNEMQRVKGVSSTAAKVATKIDVLGTNFSDRMWLFVDPSCTRNFDNGWDGYKVPGQPEATQIYGLETDGNYQIDALNDLNETYIGFQPGTETQFKLVFTHQNVKNLYSSIYLVDLVANKTTDITQNGTEYAFTGTTTDATKRFKIVTATTGLNAAQQSLIVDIYSSQNTIFIDNQTDQTGQIALYNELGSCLLVSPVQANKLNQINTNLPKGVYVVKATINSEHVTKSVIIN